VDKEMRKIDKELAKKYKRWSAWVSEASIDFIDLMSSGMNSVIDRHSDDAKSILISENWWDITVLFSALATDMELIRSIIWTKKSGWLIENLWKTCDLQCKNKWWKCYY
jgi:hypothetical protein